MDLTDKQIRTPSVGRESSLFMRGMRCDVGASLSGPCNPTSCKSPMMKHRTVIIKKTTNSKHSRFNVVRGEAYVHGRSMECILFEWRKKKKITRSRPLFSLCKKRKSNSRCNRELAAGDLIRVQKTRRAGRAIRPKLKERSPFFVGRGSLFIGEDRPHMSRGNHPVKALAAGFCDWLALN